MLFRSLKHHATISFSSVDRKEESNQLTVGICHYPIAYRNEIITKDTALDDGKCTQDELDRFALRRGRIILTKDSESRDDIGIPAYVAEDIPNAVCGYHLAFVDVMDELIVPEFLFRFLQADKVMGYYAANSYGVTRYGLGKPVIENLLVAIPPVEEQRAIVAHIRQSTMTIDKVKVEVNRVLEQLSVYRQSIISEAVTGKIDLREWEPATQQVIRS